MSKSPYSFPARSRAAMIGAIESMGHNRSYHYRSYPFCFNVKLDSGWNDGAAKMQEHADSILRPEWDSEWEAHAEKESESIFYSVQEAMHWQLEDYSTYPGDDSGQWKLETHGRGGGWLCLVGGPGYELHGESLDSIIEAMGFDDDGESDWSFPDIRTLYRALVCMTHDFRREAITNETRYQVARLRAEWEAERLQEADSAMRESIEDRDDARALLAELRGRGAPTSPRLVARLRADIEGLLCAGRECRAKAFKLLGGVPVATLGLIGESS